MQHPGHQEQPEIIAHSIVALPDLLVVIDAAERRQRRVRPPVPHDQLAALCLERAEIRTGRVDERRSEPRVFARVRDVVVAVVPGGDQLWLASDAGRESRQPNLEKLCEHVDSLRRRGGAVFAPRICRRVDGHLRDFCPSTLVSGAHYCGRFADSRSSVTIS